MTLAASSRGPTLLALELLRLAPPAAVGLVAGALALGSVGDAVVQAVLAVTVLVALAVAHARGDTTTTATAAPHPAWRAGAGLAAGALTTTIGVNGPPLVLWLRARGATPEQLRTTLAVAFLVAGVATLAVLAALGDLHPGLGAVLAGVAGVLAGHAAGRRQAAALAVGRHEWLVTAVLGLTAVGAAVSAAL